jgi:hypothetical protein
MKQKKAFEELEFLLATIEKQGENCVKAIGFKKEVFCKTGVVKFKQDLLLYALEQDNIEILIELAKDFLEKE